MSKNTPSISSKEKGLEEKENSDFQDYDATSPDSSDEEDSNKKAPHAFRTISEAADEIHVPQHVLRFWETRFPQVQPVKRSGGRRYYRVEDITLLKHISDLLYVEGYTIKGVQRLLEEESLQKTDSSSAYEEEKSNKSSDVEQKELFNSKADIKKQKDKILNTQLIETSELSELNSLKEKNTILIETLQTVMTELQELKKLIISS